MSEVHKPAIFSHRGHVTAEYTEVKKCKRGNAKGDRPILRAVGCGLTLVKLFFE
jgi:hypothetical protein